MLSVLLALTLVQTGKQDQEIQHPWHGDFKDEYKDPKTKALVMRYRMLAPERQPEEKKLGLVVYFHGMNGDENSLFGFTTGAAKRVGITDEYVIMGGKSKGAGWGTNDDKDVLAWIDWVMKTYPIDPRRVHIIGGSNGGAMVKRFGWENQSLFASISPYCGGGVDFAGWPKGMKPVPAQGPLSPAETKTEWYYVHGTDDKEVGVDSSRRACAQLKQKGYRTVYRELTGHDHGSIFRVNEVSDDNLRFIHALRHKEVPLTFDQKKGVASLAGKVKNEKAEGASVIVKEASRVGGLPGAKIIGNAVDSSDAEIRKMAAATTQSTLYGRAMVMELVKLLRDKSEEVKAEAFKGLATSANWRYEEAQAHLARVARSKNTPVAERALAVEALGKAVQLQLLGSFEDKLVVWTLVLLLDDDELKVREAAFAPLEKGVKDTFEYKPDLPTTERKTAFGKWRTWATQKAGPLEGPAAAK